MRKLIVLGSGKIGASITKLLAASGDYQLTVVDKSSASLQLLAHLPNVTTCVCDITDRAVLENLMDGQHALVSACSYHFNVPIAEVALKTGVSYFDLTEDVATTNAITAMAASAKDEQVFVPQCGLAPGFVSILAHHISKQFDSVESISLRVGALPEFPSNQMMYNLTWSTDGLINEYCNPCRAIKHGRMVELEPLEGLENFSLDGVEYEAFNTSGGLGSLCDSLLDQVQNLSYKTIRYKGHRYLMNFLINDLKLGERRQLLRKIFENAVAMTKQDVVLIMVSATGRIDGQFTQITDSRKIYHQSVQGEHWGAIQVTTAAGICALVDLYFEKHLPAQGLVCQEQVALETFLSNRFGRYYSKGDERGDRHAIATLEGVTDASTARLH